MRFGEGQQWQRLELEGPRGEGLGGHGPEPPRQPPPHRRGQGREVEGRGCAPRLGARQTAPR